MFDHRHYVPVLRWKQGEQRALQQLEQPVKNLMTPLIELVPDEFGGKRIRRATGLENRISNTTDQILNYWGKEPFFLDLAHLEGNFRQANIERILTTLSQTMASTDLSMIPMVSPRFMANYTNTVKTALNSCGKGLGIRILIDSAQIDINKALERTKQLSQLRESEIDLVLDLKSNTELIASIGSIVNGIQDVNAWRTISMTCGAMPIDLTEFPIGISAHPRQDWTNWQNHILDSQTIKRIPTFSDYTVRHSEYQEFEGVRNTSASVRYTCSDYWLILRGEWLRKPQGLGYRQYFGHSQLLVERKEYSGADFSAGDFFISQKSREEGGTGNTTTWIQIGVNHHLTFVAGQISKLVENKVAV